MNFTQQREPRVGTRSFMCNMTGCGGMYVVQAVLEEQPGVERDELKCDRCGHENIVRRVEQGQPLPAPPAGAKPALVVGDHVRKVGGDYDFDGYVIAVFQKRRPPQPWRLVVEDDRGLCHIMSEKQLVRA